MDGASALVSLNNNSAVGVAYATGPVCLTVAIALSLTANASVTQLFDAATTTGITLGTTKPAWAFPSAASSVGAATLPDGGLMFTSGIVAGTTLTPTSTTTAAVDLRLAIQ